MYLSFSGGGSECWVGLLLGGPCRSPVPLTYGSHRAAAPRRSPRRPFATAFVASPVCLRIVVLITVLAGGQYFLEAHKRENGNGNFNA